MSSSNEPKTKKDTKSPSYCVCFYFKKEPYCDIAKTLFISDPENSCWSWKGEVTRLDSRFFGHRYIGLIDKDALISLNYEKIETIWFINKLSKHYLSLFCKYHLKLWCMKWLTTTYFDALLGLATADYWEFLFVFF